MGGGGERPLVVGGGAAPCLAFRKQTRREGARNATGCMCFWEQVAHFLAATHAFSCHVLSFSRAAFYREDVWRGRRPPPSSCSWSEGPIVFLTRFFRVFLDGLIREVSVVCSSQPVWSFWLAAGGGEESPLVLSLCPEGLPCGREMNRCTETNATERKTDWERKCVYA